NLSINSRYLYMNLGYVQDIEAYENHYGLSFSSRPWRYTSHSFSHTFSENSDFYLSALESQIRINRYLDFDTELAHSYNSLEDKNVLSYDVRWSPSFNRFQLNSRYFFMPKNFLNSGAQKSSMNHVLRFNALSRSFNLFFDQESYQIDQKFRQNEQRYALNINLIKSLFTQIDYKHTNNQYSNSQTNSRELSNNWTYNESFGKLKTDYAASYKYTHSDQSADQFSQSYRSAISYPINRIHLVSASLQFSSQNSTYSRTYINSISSGIAINSLFGQKFSSSLSISNQFYLHQHTELRSNISNSLLWRISDEWNISINSGLSADNQSIYWFTGAGLSCNLSIPLQERRDLLYLKGSLFDQNQNAIERKIIKLNQNLAITNQKGDFIFPSLRPGTYQLDIPDEGDYVFSPALPLTINIKADSLQNIRFIRYPSASIEGTVKLYKPVSNWYLQKEPEFVEAEAYAGLVITAIQGNQIQTTVSDKRGHFKFNQLTSGIWLLKVEQSTLPKNFIPEWTETAIELKSAEHKIISLQLKEKLKKVIIKKIGE
ncbi:MAG TPA: hypothetical protein PKJ08_13440, partial [Candidatus Cloacimonadota bacterium]|nr:hypothetical protein [Candidatus Cloacimonadota bacterium]